jgi:signal transduction histidine kinase
MKKQAQILIIDDSEDDRDMYRRYLSGDDEIDWTISEAESAEEGPKTFHAAEEPLVLLDYSLPGRSGLDLLRDLKGTNMYAPAVLLTGQGSEIIATECMKLGAQDYLAKGDVTQEGLLRAVDNTMERVTLMRQIDQQREALEIFARLLAHDLKAPIRHIINLNEMIEDAAQQQEYDEIVNFATLAQKAGRRLRQLIDTLGEYNKFDGDIVFEPVAMEEVLRDVLSQLGDAIADKGAEVTHEELPLVHGNAPQLAQLLQNLIANALKFCNAGKPRVHIAARELGVGLCISVEDNGIGISAEDAERVFEPFRRLHSQDTYEGTGLGLATCRKIMDRHGGRIWCEPRPDGGTAFSFTLMHPDGNDT